MRAEIAEWEVRSQKRLNQCDPLGGLTLPAFYNAVALAAAESGSKKDVQSIEFKVSVSSGRT
jgi:hypothetical protein